MDRLTAAELNITERDYAALLWVRDALDPAIPDAGLPDWMVFDMDLWNQRISLNELISYQDRGVLVRGGTLDTHCGTAACIGGSMQLYNAGMMSAERPDFERGSPVWDSARPVGASIGEPLHPLFYHYDQDAPTDRATAVAAIDRFLAGDTHNPWGV